MRYLFIISSVVLFVALNNLYAQTGKWELNINGIINEFGIVSDSFF